jgi:hypothetical protein
MGVTVHTIPPHLADTAFANWFVFGFGRDKKSVHYVGYEVCVYPQSTSEV